MVSGASGVTMCNTTISGNKVNGTVGGGMLFAFLTGPVLIQNCTIAFNEADAASGVAIVIGTGGSVTMDSTILAKNIGDPDQPDLQGEVVANNCLVGVVDGLGAAFGPGSNNNLSGDATIPLNPLLGVLALNGGATLNHALLTGSPAINQGSNPAGLSNDQRGIGFARKGGSAEDIGSFEVQPPAQPTITGVQVNDGSAQRSMVTSFKVTFSETVSFPNGVALAFQLNRIGPGAQTGSINFNAIQSGPSVTFTFLNGGAVPVDQAGSLLDGIYQLTVFANKTMGGGGGARW